VEDLLALSQNILNIPQHLDIRNLFICPPGWALVDIDYSQAELVLLAYLAQDPDFIAAVNSSDLHTATAQGLMGCTEVDKEIRRKAKGVNFLKAYGGGAKKLAERLKIDESEARAWLAKWDATYPRVPAYKMEVEACHISYPPSKLILPSLEDVFDRTVI
jgi:DNA polymerase I